MSAAALGSTDSVPLRIRPGWSWPLHSVAGTRAIEQLLLAQLPSHSLMTRAGRSAARLAMALAPHAKRYWVVCGPGNNGGDGLVAAAFLQRAGRHVTVTFVGSPPIQGSDAHHAWELALSSGVVINQLNDQAPTPYPPVLTEQDLAIDALLGIGARPFDVSASAAHQPLLALARQLLALPCTVLCMDLPSGLDADTGTASLQWPEQSRFGPTSGPRHTLSLLTLKPGLFTAQGRDFSGQVWFDDLGAAHHMDRLTEVERTSTLAPVAHLNGAPVTRRQRHASHKGLRGDVSVLGGQSLAVAGSGMAGAACLAATAALHAGAGRVMLALLGTGSEASTSSHLAPELMLRSPEALDLTRGVVVAGCGGGSAIGTWLPQVLRLSPQLVLDADALNGIAQDPQLLDLLRQRQSHGWATVITPHPLEAGRLLRCSASEVQAHRIQAVQRLVDQLGCVVLLKGSGTVIGAPGQSLRINPTGNGLLASAGTGDVLAGWIGAWMAQGLSAWESTLGACWRHGEVADGWWGPADLSAAATTGALVNASSNTPPRPDHRHTQTLTALQLAQAASAP
jgi:hydroxyethylthiazole kinase-like uncharacterized protein yjeF